MSEDPEPKPESQPKDEAPSKDEPSKKYVYLGDSLEMWSIKTEEELKKKYPEVCDPGDHDWKTSYVPGVDTCTKCIARRDDRI